MAEQGYFGNIVGTIELGHNDNGLSLDAIAPNPVADFTTLQYTLPNAMDVTVLVYDMNGRLMIQQDLGRMTAGNNTYTVDTVNLANGQYVIAIVTDAGGVSQKMVVIK